MPLNPKLGTCHRVTSCPSSARRNAGVCSGRNAAVAPFGSTSPTQEELVLLGKLLRWPASALFPAVDITRLLVLHELFAARLAANAGPLELAPLGTASSCTLPLRGSM